MHPIWVHFCFLGVSPDKSGVGLSTFPCGNKAYCETLAPTNSIAEPFLQVATRKGRSYSAGFKYGSPNGRRGIRKLYQYWCMRSGMS